MTITYTLTEDDYMEFNRHVLARRSKMRVGLHYLSSGLMSLVGSLGLVFLVAEWRTTPHWYLLFYGFLAFIGTHNLWALWPSRLRRRVREANRGTPGLRGTHEITITPDGFVGGTGTGLTEVTWQNVVQVERTSKLIMLFIDPTRAYLIPTRAFSIREEADIYYKTAIAYWQHARNGAGAAPRIPGNDAWPPAPRAS